MKVAPKSYINYENYVPEQEKTPIKKSHTEKPEIVEMADFSVYKKNFSDHISDIQDQVVDNSRERNSTETQKKSEIFF